MLVAFHSERPCIFKLTVQRRQECVWESCDRFTYRVVVIYSDRYACYKASLIHILFQNLGEFSCIDKGKKVQQM